MQQEIQVQHWVRFQHGSVTAFGTLTGDLIREYRGSMFGVLDDQPQPTGREWPLHDVRLLCPTQPTKVIALWNNFAALGAKLNLAVPAEPLYLLKSPNSYAGPGDVIRQPRSRGKVVFEGELGIVIGRETSGVAVDEAMRHVFGYTCANDVTEAEILNRDASFTQWVRAKGLDTFCPMGPVIATGLDPSMLVVTTTLNDELRQNYPISDMRFSVAQLVSLISQDMTLFPGDVILCGTSIGVGSMKPGSDITVEIAGIGALRNRYE